MENGKKKWFEKMKKKAFDKKNTKSYFSAVKMLGGKEAPAVFDIRVLYPGSSDFDIAEDLASYFNGISQEFEPLEPATQNMRNNMDRNPPELYVISAALKKNKKT